MSLKSVFASKDVIGDPATRHPNDYLLHQRHAKFPHQLVYHPLIPFNRAIKGTIFTTA